MNATNTATAAATVENPVSEPVAAQCAIVRKSTIREMVLAFNATEAVIRRCYAELTQAEESLNLAFNHAGADRYCRIRIEPDRDFSGFNLKGTIEKMTRQAWQQLAVRLEMKSFLSVAKAKELDTQLDRGELPPITQENVEAFVEKYMNELPALAEEAVQEVFNFLRPRGISKKYKTNSEFEIGERVIMAYWAEQAYHSNKFRLNYYYHNEARALERVFQILDGKGLISKQYQSALQSALEAAPDGEGETEYFAFRACKNKNLHIRFKRLDLLKKLNAIAGGKNLKS